MDEREYEQKASATFDEVLDLFEDIDPDDADVEFTGDVITIEFPKKAAKVVLNTQRPARQLWLAGGRRAWHFGYDLEKAKWLDDREGTEELFDVLRGLCAASGVDLP